MHKSIQDLIDFCYLPPSQLKVLIFKHVDDVNRLKIIAQSLLTTDLNIRKVIEFFALLLDATSLWTRILKVLDSK